MSAEEQAIGFLAEQRGFVEAPGSVHKKHECPPDRVVMMQNLEEITAKYNERLANQKQVVDNLSTAMTGLASRLGRAQRLADLWDHPSSPTSFTAKEVAQQLRAVLEPHEGDTP